ncbi:MAG: hypothetical protein NW220_05280 [Leptolyngbyaceae cyanobacterium bins.349]|nr:hypothetical protein [Leptolyngbyaceae cyanobacterium bins.349]
MKPALKRIEAALQEAAYHYPDQREGSELASGPSAIALSAPALVGDTHELSDSMVDPLHNLSGNSLSAAAIALPEIESGPNLPEFAAKSEGQPHFVALTNSALALNLLKDLQNQVGDWLAQLETTLKQIQSLYQEGPIVDGWLESGNPQDPAHSSYRLCGLDQDGRLWSRPCPSAQVPDVGLAIVRYQRLQTLLKQKQRLETQLGHLTEALVDLHSHLDDRTE